MGNKLARFIIHLIVRLTSRITGTGRELLPETGSYIVTGNHLGRLDAALIYYFIDRHDLIVLVAEKYKNNALTAWFARQLDGIYVDRYNADLVAVREVLKRLKNGWMMVMAPEGTRSRTGALQVGHPGAAYWAAKSGVPIYPAGITGSEDSVLFPNIKRLRRTTVNIVIGQPFTLPPLKGQDRDETLQQYTDEIMCQIAALLPESYRGVYADHPRLGELLAEQARKESGK
jgi:1-acyl-sn-glycerol-3-phosphate acyltransferase